jgi:transcriptional regulator with XRE-family HTH domain
LGDVIKKHRQRLGISQEELAHRADVDRTFISRLERGIRQPTLTSLLQLASALEMTAADLVSEVETKL